MPKIMNIGLYINLLKLWTFFGHDVVTTSPARHSLLVGRLTSSRSLEVGRLGGSSLLGCVPQTPAVSIKILQ